MSTMMKGVVDPIKLSETIVRCYILNILLNVTYLKSDQYSVNHYTAIVLKPNASYRFTHSCWRPPSSPPAHLRALKNFRAAGLTFRFRNFYYVQLIN